MSEPVPTLKCIIAWSDRRNLCDLVRRALADVGEADAIRLNEDSWVVSTSAEPPELRDLVSARLDREESVLVFEFERWSGSGPGVDSHWLLRRGH